MRRLVEVASQLQFPSDELTSRSPSVKSWTLGLLRFCSGTLKVVRTNGFLSKVLLREFTACTMVHQLVNTSATANNVKAEARS